MVMMHRIGIGGASHGCVRWQAWAGAATIRQARPDCAVLAMLLVRSGVGHRAMDRADRGRTVPHGAVRGAQGDAGHV
jgi:hypothetical protein